MKLTVVLCAHNPRPDYLRRTLDSLAVQTLQKEEWEFLLIDNASRRLLSEEWDLSWHPHGRHVLESELGLAAARARGMKESVTDFIVFVDDDTPLDSSYLEIALNISNRWPILGVWGSGAVIPEYELEPRADLKSLMALLGIRETNKPRWSNVYPCKEANPWGAGQCVRASVADAYRRMNSESSVKISGRQGASLFSAEDNEVAYVACDLGFGMGVFPELRLTHLIPKERITRKYLLRVVEGWEASDILLTYKWSGRLPGSPFRPSGILSFVKNMIGQKGLDRQLCLARLRGLIRAKRMIAAARAKPS